MQLLFPIFPCGIKYINSMLAVKEEDSYVYYFNYSMPLFRHHKDDFITFKMYAAQLCVNGAAKQCEIVKAFGICRRTLIRAVALYREKGVAGFYEPPKIRGKSVLKDEVIGELQGMLNTGSELKDIAKKKTLRKTL